MNWSEEQRNEIERIAYFMWLDAGKPKNQDLYFWARSEDRYIKRSDIEYGSMGYSDSTWITLSGTPYVRYYEDYWVTSPGD